MLERHIITTDTSRKECYLLGESIPNKTLCGQVLSSSYYGKRNYKAISPIGMALWLYEISGNKYLKLSAVRQVKKIIEEYEIEKLARRI